MSFYKKILFIFTLFFLLQSCATLPGINQDLKERKKIVSIESEYSINDVGIEIVEINSLKENDFSTLNNKKVEELDFKVKINNIFL